MLSFRVVVRLGSAAPVEGGGATGPCGVAGVISASSCFCGLLGCHGVPGSKSCGAAGCTSGDTPEPDEGTTGDGVRSVPAPGGGGGGRPLLVDVDPGTRGRCGTEVGCCLAALRTSEEGDGDTIAGGGPD